MRTIEQAVEPYGPPVCPRCGEYAYVFTGRYNLICAECADECRSGAGEDASLPTPEPAQVA